VAKALGALAVEDLLGASGSSPYVERTLGAASKIAENPAKFEVPPKAGRN
jgi:hypothetical protein